MSRALPTSLYTLLFFVLIAANISVYRTIFAPHILEVTILETGKDDAILVRSPNGKTILINTGPDASILRALGSVLPMWQRSIDAIVLTSSKASSVGGLPEVENRYHVLKLIYIGDTAAPYGTSLIFDGSHIEIIAPSTLTISYGATTFNISSSTPDGSYISNGEEIIKTKTGISL